MTPELFTIEKVKRTVTLREFSDLFSAADEAERLAKTVKGPDKYLLYQKALGLRERAKILESVYRTN